MMINGARAHILRKTVPIPASISVSRLSGAAAESMETSLSDAEPYSKNKKKRGRATKRNYDRVNLRRELITKYAARNESLKLEADKLGLGWDFAAATIVERCSVVTPEMPKWEKDYVDVRDSLEYFKLHDWPKGIGPPHPDEIDRDGPGYTLPFETASRVTAADEANDTTSLERALEQSVYLAVKGETCWGLPEATLTSDDEMLGVASQRAVAAVAKDMPRLFHFKRQPFGQYWRAYDEATRNEKGKFGVKSYFFSALVIDPYESIFEGEKATTLPPFKALAWYTKDELCGALDHENTSDGSGHLKEYLGLLLD